ncbi:hypothetical protein CPB83DRAFT_820574 [Crepidotus variabilis]|uniref:BTB domain-containing protein n=1 Tax=Crepidotus variabilis TaxID=179855 RepID=A0A9P6JKN7_9AGAR|nr:hypothetical protein CPB83DRAFT_820574 [Crepidotus variabilis]
MIVLFAPPPMEGARPSKRPRTSDADSEQDSKFWYQDGNIILQAGQKRFKVHMGVLSRQSAVFRDMFAMPPSREENEGNEDDNCHVVVLQDSPQDLEILLTLLYDTLSIYKRQHQSKLPLPTVAAMLRMGRKYSFKHLRTQGLSYLKEQYPDALFSFDLWCPSYGQSTEGLAEVIAMGHENSLLDVLLPAYWKLLIYCDAKGIVKFFDEMDPSLKACLRFPEPITSLLGRERIRSLAFETTLSFLSEKKIPVKSCTGAKRKQCQQTVDDIQLECLQSDSTVTLKYALQPYYGYKRDFDKKFCDLCYGVLKETHSTGRSQLWSQFTEAFGISKNQNIWVEEDWASDAE